MQRKAFVYTGSNYSFSGTPLTQEYSEWVNGLLKEYPDAKFEVHQSLGSFYSEKDQMDWIQVWCLVIVTES